jgi:hypothetical protein
VQRALEYLYKKGEATLLASSVWAACHGIVSLEIAGKRPRTPAGSFPFDETIAALLRGYAPRP